MGSAREVTTFISGDTPDSIANLVTPPQRHYQSVYRTLPHIYSPRAHRVCCVATRFSRHRHTQTHTCNQPVSPRKCFREGETITHLRDADSSGTILSFPNEKRDEYYIWWVKWATETYLQYANILGSDTSRDADVSRAKSCAASSEADHVNTYTIFHFHRFINTISTQPVPNLRSCH